MDDDAFPERKCLEELLKHAEQAKVLGSLVIQKDEIAASHRSNFDLNSAFNFKTFQRYLLEDEIFSAKNNCLVVDFISFVGMLIHRNVIESVGFPEKDYFIFDDDIEYSLRIYKNCIPKLLITNTCIYHKTKGVSDVFSLEWYKKRTNRNNNVGQKEAKRILPLFYFFRWRNRMINIKTYSRKKLANYFL